MQELKKRKRLMQKLEDSHREYAEFHAACAERRNKWMTTRLKQPPVEVIRLGMRQDTAHHIHEYSDTHTQRTTDKPSESSAGTNNNSAERSDQSGPSSAPAAPRIARQVSCSPVMRRCATSDQEVDEYVFSAAAWEPGFDGEFWITVCPAAADAGSILSFEPCHTNPNDPAYVGEPTTLVEQQHMATPHATYDRSIQLFLAGNERSWVMLEYFVSVSSRGVVIYPMLAYAGVRSLFWCLNWWRNRSE